MIKIINKEFFEIKEFQSEKGNDRKLLQIKANPKGIELRYYKTDPFANIVIDSHKTIDDLEDMSPRINSFYDPLSLAHDYKMEFSKAEKFSSLIVDEDPNNNNMLLMLVAMPIIGILGETLRSSNYKLYGGSFAKANKVFYYNGYPCYGIGYYFVNVRAAFTIYEYAKIEGETEFGIARKHDVKTSLVSGKIAVTIEDSDNIIAISGNEDLFIPNSKRNLFALSDRPSAVLTDNRGPAPVKL